jgi:predicted enzyme related to lactoylglutathione lyase
MRPYLSKILALSLMFAGACGASAQSRTAAEPKTEATQAAPARKGLQIQLATVYVDDQEKALRFYTDVLGFAKKDDVSNGPFRWLTVTAAGDADGTALLLALNDNPAAKAFQEARFKQSEPAAMFFTDDIKRDYERIKARGVAFTMPPTEVMPGSTIATLNDTCGNLIQITQLSPEK